MKIIKIGEDRYQLSLGIFVRNVGAGNRASAKAMFEREVQRVWKEDFINDNGFADHYKLTTEERDELLRIVSNNQIIH